jgi:DNA polymerase III delta prime subunit
MNELDIYSEDAITWTSRNDCVIDCAESWRQFDAAGWQLIAKVSKAKESYGATILIDIAEARHKDVHTLQNWLSTWNSPVRQKAIELELTPGHVDAIAGIAATDAEQAEDYLQTAAEHGLSVMALRRHVASSGSVDFPTSGAQAPPVAVSAQEAITGVWIRNDDTPEQVYDKVTQIFPAEWTVRFYKLVAKGDVT